MAQSPEEESKAPEVTCDHDEGRAFQEQSAPLEGVCRCSLCGVLGYRRKRPGHRGAKRGSVRLYMCRVKGCKRPVVERRFGNSWQLANGCHDHPVR